MNNADTFCLTFITSLILVLILVFCMSVINDRVITMQERLDRIEYAFDSGVGGLHRRLDSIETKVYSYEDAMEAIALVLERNSGYYLYQELGIVVMSHDEYLRRDGN